jgi:hypothetical protein
MTLSPYGFVILTISQKNGVVVNDICDYVQWLQDILMTII